LVRLFVALPLPDETRAAVSGWARSCGAQPGLRWTPEEQLHITLHFLGEVADARASDVVQALDGIRARAFEVELERTEVLGRAGVLAAAAKLTPALAALEVEVRTRMSEFAEKADGGREFRPHVTLGRTRRGAAAPTVKTLPAFPKLEFRAECFRLYRSELRQDGAVHTMVREWRLESSAAIPAGA
jgi:RNA 2',3'-cyclic 3'-phosphodiesterase